MASHWLENALAQTDGTIGGLAIFMADMPAEAHPPFLQTAQRAVRVEAYARMVHDIFLTVNVMQDAYQQEFNSSEGTEARRREDAWAAVADMPNWLKWSGVDDEPEEGARRAYGGAPTGQTHEEGAPHSPGRPCPDSPRLAGAPRQGAEAPSEAAAAASGSSVPTDSPASPPASAADRPAPVPERPAAGMEGGTSEEGGLPQAAGASPRGPGRRPGRRGEAGEDQEDGPEDADIEAPGASHAPRVDIDKRLILVGDANGWSVSAAEAGFQLAPCSGRVPKPGVKESKVRVEVPPEGTAFLIHSAAAPEQWALCPGLPPGASGRARSVALREGSRDGHVLIAVGRHRLEKAAGRLFEIPGGKRPFVADVRVALREGQRPEVWFTEAV